MKIYSFSSKGNRFLNQDYFKNVVILKDISMHIVADGIGGYKYGELAAKIATDTFTDFIVQNIKNTSIENNINMAFVAANNAVIEESKKLKSKIGTTIAGVIINQNDIYAFWLGDVRIYLFRGNKQLFVSKDHSLINQMRNEEIVPIEKIDKYKHIITKSIPEKYFKDPVPIVKLNKEQNDTIIICSDGLHNNIDPCIFIEKKNVDLDKYLNEYSSKMNDNYTITLLKEK